LIWEKHYQAICQQLNIPLTIQNVKISIEQYRKQRKSPEEAYRKARYQAFTK